jgi:hypothetical protein
MEVEKTYFFRNRREFWIFCIIPWKSWRETLHITRFKVERIIPLHDIALAKKKKKKRSVRQLIKFYIDIDKTIQRLSPRGYL